MCGENRTHGVERGKSWRLFQRLTYRYNGKNQGKAKTMTIDELLIQYRDENISKRDTGAKFERLMKNFFLTYPVYRGMFSDVWL